ncbi:hypothetical protein KCU78_g14812, partial [Aureobasidium melanogenum]
MHFNTLALTLGLAATLGAAALLTLPPMPTLALQDCLKSKPAPKEGDQQHPPQEAGVDDPFKDVKKAMDFMKSIQRWEYSLENQTVNKICSHGEKRMSGARPFRKFEKHVYGAMKRCPEVDMRSLEHLFWDVNHQCHKKWMGQTKAPEDLSPDGPGEADAAEEKDEALSDDDDDE